MSLKDNEIKFFADYIQKHLGIVYLPQNYFQLTKRLEDIAKILHVNSIDQLYSDAVKGISIELKQVLLDIATNNETLFFRDPAIYRGIEEKVIPTVISQYPKKANFLIWSCASSFGQEPYSLAILTHEYSLKNISAPKFEILATDISDKALTRAKEGKYSQLEIQRGLSAQRMIKYFKKDEEGQWIIVPELQAKLRFYKQNLLDPFLNKGPFDLVLCRYVLIYQADEMKKEIIEKIANVINPGGFLVLGGTESMFGLSNQFEQISYEGAILYQKKK